MFFDARGRTLSDLATWQPLKTSANVRLPTEDLSLAWITVGVAANWRWRPSPKNYCSRMIRMGRISYIVSFPDSTLDRATIYSRDLAETVLDNAPASGVEAQILRTDPQHQNPGSELALILNTGAVVGLGTAVGHGIASFLRRNSGVKIAIRTEKGEMIVGNVDSRNAAEVVKAFSRSD